ncbi:MAG: hypothetical protein ACE5HP_02075 [Gemmatimonadota bacterium]
MNGDPGSPTSWGGTRSIPPEAGRDPAIPPRGQGEPELRPETGAGSGVSAGGRLQPRVWILGGLMVLLGAVTSVLLFTGFRSDSYLYLAFYCAPANTAVSVFPHEPVLIYFGKFANAWGAALAATAGTAAAGYLDHSVFVPVLNHDALGGYRRKALYRRAIRCFRRAPFLTLLVAALLPVPFFPFKFLSFSVRYPLGRYLTALLTARFPRYYFLAWAGAAFHIPGWILIGTFLLIIAVYAVKAGPGVWAALTRGRAET